MIIIAYLKRRKRKKVYLKKWRNKYNDSFIVPTATYDMERIHIGKGSYGPLKALIAGEYGNLYIGRYCSIAEGSVFCVSVEHNLKTVSTYPFQVLYGLKEREALSKGDVVVEDDVWIGENAIILSGITIGQGSVIGAGTVVTKDIPPYSVVVGNPGRVIKKRFSDEIIKQLLKIDYSKLNVDKIKNNVDLLYENLNEENVDEIVKMINGN